MFNEGRFLQIFTWYPECMSAYFCDYLWIPECWTDVFGFFQEIKVLSNLKHPNIVQYYGSKIVRNFLRKLYVNF